MRKPRSLYVIIGSLLLLLACGGVVVGMWKEPFPGLDDHTVFICQFEGTDVGESQDGSNNVKSNFDFTPGIFNTTAGRIPSQGGFTGIYRTTEDFDASGGTIEMWVKPSPLPTEKNRYYLFSLQGLRSLDDDTADSDPFPDLVVSEPRKDGTTPNLAKIYFSNGQNDLDFANPATFPSVTARGLAVGDVNDDDKPDLVTANVHASKVRVFYGPFKPGEAHDFDDELDVKGCQGLTLADLDLDGDLDIVAASFDPGTPPLVGFENQGGSFQEMTWTLTNMSGEGVAVGDVDKDGVPDIAFGNFTAGNSILFLGEIEGGDYRIGTGGGFMLSIGALGVSMGDVNRDGWPDIALARPFGDGDEEGDVAIHLNHKDGSFASDPEITISTTRPFTVCAERDINNDGFLDVVVANWKYKGTTKQSTVYLGPNFDPLSALKFDVDNAVSMTVGDTNADGINDVFFRSSTEDFSYLYRLDINGGKTGPPEQIPTISPEYHRGVGCYAALPGTSAYGSNLNNHNSFELYIETGVSEKVCFAVTDKFGVRREVKTDFPGPVEDMENGFTRIQAEWFKGDGAMKDGLLELRVGDPGNPANVTRHTVTGGMIVVEAVAPFFRLGTDYNNQYPAKGFALDDVRISSLRRSENVCQKDMGYGGPGNAHLSVCGQYLYEGNSATLLLESDLPLTSGLFIYTGDFNPTFVKPLGGYLVEFPFPAWFIITTDQYGAFTLPLDGGTGGSPNKEYLYVQIILEDGTQPKGWTISNIVEIEFLPS